jgi:hypothetical protein
MLSASFASSLEFGKTLATDFFGENHEKPAEQVS